MMKTYFLTRPDILATNEQLKLGTIVFRPQDPLAHYDTNTPPIPKSEIHSTTLKNYEYTSSTSKKFSAGVFTKWLSLLISKDKEDTKVISAEELIQQNFSPSIEYITQSMQSPIIQDYLHEGLPWRSLYMITGIQVAHNVEVKSNITRDLLTDTSTLLTPSDLGVSINTNIATASLSKLVSQDSSFEVRSFVFAYELRKIVIRTIFKRPRMRGNFKGTMFSTDADLWNATESDEESESASFEVLGVEKKDLDADDIGVSSVSAIDEHTGESVESIAP